MVMGRDHGGWAKGLILSWSGLVWLEIFWSGYHHDRLRFGNRSTEGRGKKGAVVILLLVRREALPVDDCVTEFFYACVSGELMLRLQEHG